EPVRQRTQKLRIEADRDQRPERHVAGDSAEWVEDRDRHQVLYERPVPVLKTTTSAPLETRPSRAIVWSAARAAPPSGAASMPVTRPISVVASRMASSETATASPSLSRTAL